MRPQTNEPCNYCKHWSNRTGCKIDRYDSTSMVMFGHCGTFDQKPFKHTDVTEGQRFRSKSTLVSLSGVWRVHKIGDQWTDLIRAEKYHYPDEWNEDGVRWRILTDNLCSKKFTRVL